MKKTMFALFLVIALTVILTACYAKAPPLNDSKEGITGETTNMKDEARKILPSGSTQNNISAEGKKLIFNLARENRFDYVPWFDEGKVPTELTEYVFYAYSISDECILNKSNTITPGEIKNVIIKHFEVEESDIEHKIEFLREWELIDGVYHGRAWEGRRDKPLYNLIEYNTYEENGKTIYDVLVESYGISVEIGVSLDEFPTLSEDAINDTIKYASDVAYIMDKKGERIMNGEITASEAMLELFIENDTQNLNMTHRERYKFYFSNDTGEVVFLENKIMFE